MAMRLVARAIAFAFVPPALLYAIYLASAARDGAGVAGGLAAAAALGVYALIFGPASAAQRVAPRALLAIAAAATLGVYGAPVLEALGAPPLAAPAHNAIAFALIAASAPAALMALFGRAHALRKGDS